MLQQQRRDYEQALNSVDQLSRRLDTALVVSMNFSKHVRSLGSEMFSLDKEMLEYWLNLRTHLTYSCMLYNNHTFWYISLLSTARLSCEISQWHILCRTLTNGRVNSLFLNLNGIPNNLIQEKFTYFLTN